MLPELSNILQTEVKMPSYTYNINIESKRITGKVDYLDAMRQAIYLILNTERYEALIYNWYYGVELDALIGQSRNFVDSELKRRITEALMEDDRVIEITNFTTSYNNDIANVAFTVITDIGDIDVNKEVKL